MRNADKRDNEQRPLHSAYWDFGATGGVTAGGFKCRQECYGDGDDQCGAGADVWDDDTSERDEWSAVFICGGGDGGGGAVDGDGGIRIAARGVDDQQVGNDQGKAGGLEHAESFYGTREVQWKSAD